MRKSAPDVGALALHAADGLVVRHEKIERMPSDPERRCCARSAWSRGHPRRTSQRSTCGAGSLGCGGMDERCPGLCSMWRRSSPTRRSMEPSYSRSQSKSNRSTQRRRARSVADVAKMRAALAEVQNSSGSPAVRMRLHRVVGASADGRLRCRRRTRLARSPRGSARCRAQTSPRPTGRCRRAWTAGRRARPCALWHWQLARRRWSRVRTTVR